MIRCHITKCHITMCLIYTTAHLRVSSFNVSNQFLHTLVSSEFSKILDRKLVPEPYLKPMDDIKNENVMRVYMIRHGESEYNRWRRDSLKKMKLLALDNNKSDAPLTCDATKIAGKLNKIIMKNDLNIEMIYTSPLRRAIDTTLYSFEGVNINVHAMHELREKCETFSDIGLQKSILQKMYPQINFDRVPENWWYQEDGYPPPLECDDVPMITTNTDSLEKPSAKIQELRGKWPKNVKMKDFYRYCLFKSLVPQEPMHSVDDRIRKVQCFLQKLECKTICIVGHSLFFKRWTNHSKMNNLEMREYLFNKDTKKLKYQRVVN
eukprot:GHVL01042727.1.p1 GENE.GHVL01042727.1~~GHVL01042727.1.p1  ORF type:complete len:321 (+),score=45.08 GHVL01042727.1:308-1270(+)